ncbi:putative disrupter of telomere silencing protein Dot5 [Penicillium brasilianum]|uniref:Putative disrupter of telomere silencing protein Dot5 n=1 Tax=Penicillium brasilianum TaxID=104259 RepID=A0A1S9RM45_PENBI|nr:putative disrupter of telomere silencing protein Dot5 [Penicillium brasilianum]
MVELRKRKAPAPPPVVEKKSKPAPKPKVTDTPKETPTEAPKKPTVPEAGDTINLDDFGGEIETNDGTKTTLKKLVEESKSGVVLFTYPKASTPGCMSPFSLMTLPISSSALLSSIFRDRAISSRVCIGTKQVCLFRDNYTHLTSTGLSIYGLSADSPKANTTFKTKQNLSYSLLCDPSATLIGAIGFKKAPKGTTRGVFAVDKKGKVLIREAGGPDATVDAVQKLVARGPDKSEAKEEAGDDAEAK